MIWYLLLLILSYIIFFTVVVLCYRHRKEKIYAFDEWCEDHKKTLLYSALLPFILTTAICVKPLFHTVSCQFDGFAHHASTEYSWYKGQCLYESKTGVWLPLNMSRNIPDGSDHTIQNDN